MEDLMGMWEMDIMSDRLSLGRMTLIQRGFLSGSR